MSNQVQEFQSRARVHAIQWDGTNTEQVIKFLHADPNYKQVDDRALFVCVISKEMVICLNEWAIVGREFLPEIMSEIEFSIKFEPIMIYTTNMEAPIEIDNTEPTSLTLFNPENKAIGEMSYGDYCNPFMKITNQKDANQYLLKALAYDRLCFPNKPVHKLIYEQVHNISYIAHKHDKETEKRVKALLNDSL